MSKFVPYGAVALAALATISEPALAQPAAYPTRNVEIIVPYGPGGSTDIAATRAMVQAGKLRWLAISLTQRFPALLEIPTMNEIVPGVVMDGWFVLVAPTGVPAEAVQRMNREIGEFLKSPDIHERLAGFGLATSGAGTPESTGEFISREQAKWRALARELDIQPQ